MNESKLRAVVAEVPFWNVSPHEDSPPGKAEMNTRKEHPADTDDAEAEDNTMTREIEENETEG